MNTHSPAPWVVLPRYFGSNTIPIGRELGDGAVAIFAEFNGLGGVTGQTEGDANARLAVSAPELLAALAGVPDMLETLADDAEEAGWPARARNARKMAKQARAAIAKATGNN